MVTMHYLLYYYMRGNFVLICFVLFFSEVEIICRILVSLGPSEIYRLFCFESPKDRDLVIYLVLEIRPLLQCRIIQSGGSIAVNVESP